MKTKEDIKNTIQNWTDYYTNFKGEIVISANAYKQGKRDNQGFQKYLIVVNVKTHYTYVFNTYSK